MNIKYYCLLSFVVLLFSCVNNSENTDEVKVFDVSNPEQVSLGDIFSELEVIYMDAGVESYVQGTRYVRPCGDKYLFMDNSLNIYVFDTKGHYISSSKDVKGHGRGEFIIPMGGCYNPYTKNIEIITPTHLMFYDMNFKFVKSVQLPSEYPGEKNDNKSLFFDEIYDLSDHLHILITNNDRRGQDVNSLFLFDSKTKQIIKKMSFDEDVIHDIHSQAFPFQDYDDENLLFLPPRTSKYIYKFNKETHELHPFISFKYGEDYYSEEKLEQICKSSGPMEMYKYMNNNPKNMPLRESYSDGKFYILADGGTSKIFDSNLIIVDTNTENVKILPFKKDDKNQLYIPSLVSDNILYISQSEPEINESLIASFPGKVTEINKYKADSTLNDNIAVLKYHLK